MSRIIDFQQHGDSRGMLVALEYKKEIPFEIKRVYYIYNTEINVRRGFHAHKHLEQVLICIHGNCWIHLDDGEVSEEVYLNEPNKGLYLKNNIWREMYNFSQDAVLLVLASELYDESDYIRNYDKFLEFVNGKKD